jgi:hypothetical protein
MNIYNDSSPSRGVRVKPSAKGPDGKKRKKGGVLLSISSSMIVLIFPLTGAVKTIKSLLGLDRQPKSAKPQMAPSASVLELLNAMDDHESFMQRSSARTNEKNSVKVENEVVDEVKEEVYKGVAEETKERGGERTEFNLRVEINRSGNHEVQNAQQQVCLIAFCVFDDHQLIMIYRRQLPLTLTEPITVKSTA